MKMNWNIKKNIFNFIINNLITDLINENKWLIVYKFEYNISFYR